MVIVEIILHTGKRINYYACSTLYSLIIGDLDGLQNLLQFGYNVNEYKMALYNSDALYSYVLDSLSNFRKDIFEYVPQFDFRCQDLYQPVAKYRPNGAIWSDADLSRRLVRKSVVHEVIVFLLKYSVTSEAAVKALMLRGFHVIWRSRSTPYVRMHEILSALREDWINYECPGRCWEGLQEVCREYAVLFRGMSEGALTPRSLKQLSRCAVRESLMKTSWCFGIQKLKIPEKLKSYLQLES